MKIKIIKFNLFLHTIFNFLIVNTTNNFFLLTYQIPKISASGGPLNKDFINSLVKAYNLTIFVETGTASGETTKNASDFFSEIHSLELDENLYNLAKKTFKDNKNVNLYLGESEKILNQILPNIKGNILFWLDAHYSGPGTAKSSKLTPIIEELNAIKNSKIANAVILVDDMMWHNYNYGKEIDYPNFSILYKIFKQINNDYDIILMGDVICAFPPNKHVQFSSVLKACSSSILFNNQTDFKEIIQSEEIIAKANDSEQDAIIQYWNFYKNHSFCDIPIFNFWYGLICKENKDFKNAIYLFQKAQNLGLDLNRINPHLKQFYK